MWWSLGGFVRERWMNGWVLFKCENALLCILIGSFRQLQTEDHSRYLSSLYSDTASLNPSLDTRPHDDDAHSIQTEVRGKLSWGLFLTALPRRGHCLSWKAFLLYLIVYQQRYFDMTATSSHCGSSKSQAHWVGGDEVRSCGQENNNKKGCDELVLSFIFASHPSTFAWRAYLLVKNEGGKSLKHEWCTTSRGQNRAIQMT